MERPRRGTTPVSYSEILRLVGAYADRINLSEIRVLETEDGIILQGLVMDGDDAGQRSTYQLTRDDIQMLLEDALARRGKQIR